MVIGQYIDSINDFARSYQGLKYQRSYEIIKSIAIACFAAITVCFGMGIISTGVGIGGGLLCGILALYHHRKKEITAEHIKNHDLRKLTPAQVEEKLKLHHRKDGRKTEFEHANEPDKLNTISDLVARRLNFDYERDTTPWFHYEFGVEEGDHASVAELKGLRDAMEDAHIITSLNVLQKSIPLYGVFDGNGGDEIANYLKNNIKDHLEIELTRNAENGILTDCAITNVLKTAFAQLMNIYTYFGVGSTANIVLKIDNALWVANVGDTRAVLCVGGKAIALSDDACADVLRFIPSVERRGGKAELWAHPQGNVWRIDGWNMARNVSTHLKIPCRPKIIKYPIDNVQGKLIIACDGFWDVFSSNEAAAAIHNSKYTATKDLAEYFAKCAFLRGSSDNITMMVVDI